MRVLLRSNVVQLDDVAALGAALKRAIPRDLDQNISIHKQTNVHAIYAYRQPVNLVRVNRVTGATSVLLVTSTIDDNGVLESSCKNSPPISNPLTCIYTTRIRNRGRNIPFLEASRGLMSKMSMPCILPISSRRSIPVAWSTSVGTVPGLAPGGMRSSSVLSSVEVRRDVVSMISMTRACAWVVLRSLRKGQLHCIKHHKRDKSRQ